MKKIIVKVFGGMVQDVYTDSPEEVEVEVWDQDALHDGNLSENEEQDEIERDKRLGEEVLSMRHIY